MFVHVHLHVHVRVCVSALLWGGEGDVLQLGGSLLSRCWPMWWTCHEAEGGLAGRFTLLA